MKSLITQLKAINQRMIDFSDGNDTVHTIALSLSTKLPEIISTLERQEKLLGEARLLIGHNEDCVSLLNDFDTIEFECNCQSAKWLAALDEEGK